MRLHHLSLIAMGFLSLFSFLRADPLNVGDPAPQITAKLDDGTDLNLGDAYKKGYTVVYFYPKAFTGGCTAQSCSLRDSYSELQKRHVNVIGVSTDDVETQHGFREKYHFPFPLIADTDKKVIHAFGQTSIKFADRQAFLIDPQGKVVWRDLEHHTKDQADQVIAALDKLGIK